MEYSFQDDDEDGDGPEDEGEEDEEDEDELRQQVRALREHAAVLQQKGKHAKKLYQDYCS